jgi:hypothetical protein
MFGGYLAGNDGGGATVAIVENLQKVAPFGWVENRKAPIVEDQELNAAERSRRRGDPTSMFTSEIGTKRTSGDICYLVAFGGKADISQRLLNEDRSVGKIDMDQRRS